MREEPASKGNRSGLGLLIVLAAVQFTHILDFMILMPLGPRYLAEMGINPEQFGWLIGAYAFAAAISGLLAATCIDRFDRKKALLFLYGGFTVATIACGFAHDFWSMLIARSLTGMFGGIIGAICLAVVGDVFPENRRGFATGVVMSSFAVTTIVGVPLGLLIANHFGKSAPFVVLGAVSVLLWFMAQRLLPNMISHLDRPRAAASLLRLLVSKRHLWAYALMTSLVFSTFMIIPYIATYLVCNTGFHLDNVMWVYLCGGAATLIGMPRFGRMADRYGKLVVFRVLALLTGVGIFCLTHLQTNNLAVTLAATTLFMVVTSGRMVPAMAMITSTAAPSYRGSFLSVNAAVQQGACGLASVIAGKFLTQQVKDGPLIGFDRVGYMGMALVVVSLILAGRLGSAPIEDTNTENVIARA